MTIKRVGRMMEAHEASGALDSYPLQRKNKGCSRPIAKGIKPLRMALRSQFEASDTLYSTFPKRQAAVGCLSLYVVSLVLLTLRARHIVQCAYPHESYRPD